MSIYRAPKGPPDEGILGMRGRASAGCDLDGTLYHTVEMEDIADGSAAAPVTVDDNGYIYKTRMVAGSVGICVTSSGDTLDSRKLMGFIPGYNGEWIPQYTEPECGLDSFQPVSGW